MRLFKNNYKGRKCLPESAELNGMANFINNIVQGRGIQIERPDNPSLEAPVVISLDEEYIASIAGGGGGDPHPPSTYDTLSTNGEGTATADTRTHNSTGTKGLQMTVCTRVCYIDTSPSPVLYGFFRTLTFDETGRLYSVSAETRYVIDTPVIGNLSEP